MKTYNLLSLSRDYSICIPAIQREYVQGFNEENINQIRNKFFDDIFCSLAANDSDKKLKINIIYGYVDKKHNTFYPVDGQQRLTTLFILHWFLWIKSENINEEFFRDKVFSYEIRSTADLFIKELINNIRRKDYELMLTSKEPFFDCIIKMKWFRSEWNNDVTVLAIINVISELKNRNISKEQAITYYSKLQAGNIYFDFFALDANEAKRTAIIDYARMNTRGKELELFENIKAIISSIENQINIEDRNKKFTNSYDEIYCDYFYSIAKSDTKSLEQINKDINNTVLYYMLNSFNLVELLHRGNSQNLLKTKQELVFKINVNYSRENDNSLIKKYLEFLNNTLMTISMLSKCREKHFEFYDGYIKIDHDYSDRSKDIALLLYFNEYYIAQGNYLNEEQEAQFLYVLANLSYSEWKQKRLSTIILFIKEISRFNSIYEYFVKRSVKEISVDLSLGEKENGFGVKDLLVRIKEQKIKFLLCKLNCLKYNYFEKLESKFPHKRSIYYLLRFVNLWENYPDEKCIEVFPKLNEYVNVANKFFYEIPNIEFLKKFALVTYYDEKNKSLLKSDEINRKASYEYILDKKEDGTKILEGNNLHHWNDSFYFIESDMFEKNVDKELKRIKLNKLKLLYDFYIQGMEELEKELNKDDYKECWLQYAYNDNYEELFVQHLMFENNKVKIDSNLGEHKHSNVKNYINFFAYRYLKEKEEKRWIVNRYTSYIYDPTTVNVRDTLFWSRLVDFETIKMGKIINSSELKFIWQDENEMRLDCRSFFYIIQRKDFVDDSDTLIEFDGINLIKRRFDYSEYPHEICVNFSNEIEQINKNIEEERKCRNSIAEKYNEYVSAKLQYQTHMKEKDETAIEEKDENNKMNITEEKLKELYDQFKALITKNYRVAKSYYKNEQIYKYIYNPLS